VDALILRGYFCRIAEIKARNYQNGKVKKD
jgi:hypothetical protein